MENSTKNIELKEIQASKEIVRKSTQCDEKTPLVGKDTETEKFECNSRS